MYLLGKRFLLHYTRNREGIHPDDQLWKRDRETILAVWHCGQETIRVPRKRGKPEPVSMGLEMKIRADLIGSGVDPAELSKALRFVRVTDEFRPEDPISLRLIETRPEVLTRMIAASQKGRMPARSSGEPTPIGDLVDQYFPNPRDRARAG